LKPVNFIEMLSHALGKLPTAIVGAWLVMGILLLFGLAARSALASAADPMLPDEGVTLRHIAEVIAEWLDGFVAQVSELHGARRFVPFFGSIFMFILTANFLGKPDTSFTVVGPTPDRNAATVGVSANLPLSLGKAFVNYDANLSQSYSTHAASLGLKIAF